MVEGPFDLELVNLPLLDLSPDAALVELTHAGSHFHHVDRLGNQQLPTVVEELLHPLEHLEGGFLLDDLEQLVAGAFRKTGQRLGTEFKQGVFFDHVVGRGVVLAGADVDRGKGRDEDLANLRDAAHVASTFSCASFTSRRMGSAGA